MEERGWKLATVKEEEPGKDSDVFFNEKMRTNRDISEIAGRVFRSKIDTEQFKVCDPTAGSGIRGFRYSDIAEKLFINDTNPEAVESIETGLKMNDIEADISCKDANILLSENRNRFHLVDVDPFGPFTPYLDSVARAANHSSFAGFTATDNGVPGGSYRKVCMRRYASKPLKNSLMHETGLRIYIKTVFENFARHDKCFDPKICFHERHYTRIMGRVTESKKRTNKALENIGYLSFCPECRWRKLEKAEKCRNCGGTSLRYAGPLWTGKLSDQRFTAEMLEEFPEAWKDSRSLLETVDSEAEIMTPFYDLHKLSSNLEIQVPKRDEVIEKIREKGYPVSRTHFADTGFRTDAPVEDIRKIVSDIAD